MTGAGLARADWFVYALAIAALIIAARVVILDRRARRIARQTLVDRARGAR